MSNEGIARRHFLATAGGATMFAGAASLGWANGETAATAAKIAVPDGFPSHDPASIREVVLNSHRSLDAVKPLVDAVPELAKAAIDWGFGDWESALGAASHMGHRDLALYLIERGARPDIFAFTMLGRTSVVKAMLEAQPDLARLEGPHGFSLLHHARVGGKEAKPLFDYLVERGDADPESGNVDEGLISDALVGEYEQGSVVFKVDFKRNRVQLAVGDAFPRVLTHLGDHEFYPAGARSVRIAFQLDDQKKRANTVTIVGGTGWDVRAKRRTLSPS